MGLGALTLAVALAGACGSDEDDEGGQPPPREPSFEDLAADAEDLTGQPAVTVAVPDNRFEPVAVVVDAGTTVTWENVGRNDHNVTPAEEGAFEGVVTDEFAPDATHEATFDEPGTYGYFCSVHGTAGQGQRGVVVVS